jgi:hypothetical protein
MSDHMTTHHCADPDVRDALPELLHGALSGAARARAEAHVAACAACTAELALLGGAMHVLRVDAPSPDVGSIADQVRRAMRAGGTARDAAWELRAPGGGEARVEVVRPPLAPIARRRAPAWRLQAAALALLTAGAGAVFVARDGPAGGPASAAGTAAGAAAAAAPSVAASRGARAAPRSVGAATSAPLGDMLADLSDEEVQLIVAEIDGDTGPQIEPDGAEGLVTAGGF